MKKEVSFTEGPILSPLLKFTVPVLAALFLQAMYGAVDLLVVGQFGSPADVSAVATGSQIMHTVTGFVTNLSMGATILLGQKLGQKRRDEAGQVVGSAVSLFTLIAILLTAAMLFTARPLSALMRAPTEAFERTVTYVLICSGGAVLIVVYNVLGAVFRGIGDSKTPLLAVAIACTVNIAGDLLLVGAFRMGVAGAAVATIAAQGVSVVLSLFVTARRGLPFDFSRACLRPQSQYIAQIMKLGTPVALQSALVSVSFMAITAIVNGLGGSGRSGETVRVHHAGALGVHAVPVGLCGPEHRRRGASPGQALHALRHGRVHGLWGGAGVYVLLPRRGLVRPLYPGRPGHGRRLGVP